MSEIVFLLEEYSAEALLKELLPRLLPEGSVFRCIVFEGKQDLEKQLTKKIRGYRTPNARFIVLRDKDSGDCRETKDRLTAYCHDADRPDVLVRIACHELESWYLADLAAAERAFETPGIARYQHTKLYRDPDKYPSPSKTLARIVPTYRKINGSRMIGPHLDIENTRSHSFRAFVEGVRRIAGAE